MFQDFLNCPNELLRAHTLTFIGHLAKHSQYFFEDYAKYNVFRAVAESVKKYGTSTNRILKGIVYSVGNVSFYSDR